MPPPSHQVRLWARQYSRVLRLLRIRYIGYYEAALPPYVQTPCALTVVRPPFVVPFVSLAPYLVFSPSLLIISCRYTRRVVKVHTQTLSIGHTTKDQNCFIRLKQDAVSSTTSNEETDKIR